MKSLLSKWALYRGALLLGAVFIVAGTLFPVLSHAVTINPAPAARVSFTFDDSLQSVYTQAAPTLAQYGLTGTSYAITNCIGMTTVPNTCRANTKLPYASWDQMVSLQNTYGWEIGSHTAEHYCLASNAAADPSDCQAATLTQARVDNQLSASKNALAAHGINATAFAPPYGDYSNMVMAEVAKYYTSMRGFKEQGTNVWPLDDYLLNNLTVQEVKTPVSTVKAKIDQAIASNSWLILSFHDIAVNPSQKPNNYQYGTAELAQIAAYVKQKQTAGLITASNVSKGLVTSDTNMLPNGSFANGISNGWTTDNPTNITADSATNGSYPDPVHSIKLVSNPNGSETHLFSPQVNVSANTTYMFKNFLNLQSITSGGIGYYVDEYDASDNWISGQYLKRETSSFVEDMNFAYKPTSVAVSKARLQIIVGGSGITAYADTAQMFPLSTTAVTAPNLMPNGSFDSGIANGWTTDTPSYITADSANHGSPDSTPATSVKLTAGSATGHLFSPQISVSSTNSYNLSSYLNISAISGGEVAFYVDEYDASGNWISGQYKLGVRSVSSGDISFAYLPSSASVAKASLQIIVVGNSGITAFLDNVRWYQN